MIDKLLLEDNTDTKCCKGPFIKASIPISIASSLLIMILFIVSIAMEKPLFKDYHTIPLVSITLMSIYLLSYGIIALNINWSDRSSINGMFVFSLVTGALFIILCIFSLTNINSYILSTLILAFGLVASLIILILNLLFRLYHSKEENPNADLPEKARPESIDIKPPAKENGNTSDDLLINVSNDLLNPKDEKSQNKRITRPPKGEIGEDSKANLINEEEIEECITRELPAMHNPEIMKHMKVVGGQKVVWDKTHFIIALESGGNSYLKCSENEKEMERSHTWT